MTKFRIDQAPTFTVDVSVPRAGGEAITVPITYRFMDREQLAEYFDGLQAHREEIAAALEGGATVRDITSTVIEHQVQTLSKIVAGWGFEDEFGEASLRAFARSFAAAPEAVVRAFAASYDAARLGN